GAAPAAPALAAGLAVGWEAGPVGGLAAGREAGPDRL
ncbi:MAG: hypothetical protein QOE15_1861, partial [Acidimicrobiaceae bacterium]|nr:hypothetical protein [Acidimicrobiaceae bacterium]